MVLAPCSKTSFAWSRLEPREGQFDLDWLERSVNLADHIVTFLVNFSSAPQQVSLPKQMTDELHSNAVAKVHLDVYDVALLEQRK